jgi:beta-glucosidase
MKPSKTTFPGKNGVESFPPDFWWGISTASYQIEGAVKEGGRGVSIWDTFSHLPGKITNGDTGDVACDHYHRFKDDVKLMAELGVRHYRFSIAWPRILPEGRGTVNEQGVDFYRRLADELLAHDITPHATLYHWDLPQALQDAYGGWASREIVKDFGAYAEATVKRLGDRITHWMTINEICTFVELGWDVGKPGYHAPGAIIGSQAERSRIYHHALLAHGTACQAIRAASPGRCHVSVAENYEACVPVIETPADIEAAGRAFVRERNGRVLIPMLTGRYDEGWLADHPEEIPEIADGDMALIAQPLDGLGFNCYTGTYVRAADNTNGYETIRLSERYPKLNMPWLNIVPESIYWGIRWITDAVGQGELPVFIAENGCADGADPDPDGVVHDVDRIMYYRAYLRQVQRAVAEGYPVTGYLPWSLMDNFEWYDGYAKRFGMIRVDFQTQARTPKLSFDWYRQVIEQNRVV